MNNYLGIDLGTSSVKIILIDDQQQVLANVQAPLIVSHPQPLWSEQDPALWWQATNLAMQDLKQQHPTELQAVAAIGLSGQMHGTTLLNKDHEVLRPAILWNDGRAEKQCQQLMQRVANAAEITANLVMPGFSAPKLLWVKEHEPDIFRQIHKVLLPKDYLRLLMSGDYATDLSDASGTSWLNVKKRDWSDEMLNATSLSRAHMPTLFEGNEITGTLLPKLASRWGIPKNTRIIAGGGDNAASAISMGVIKAGSALLSIGTSGVYFVADNKVHAKPESALHCMCHCLPSLWHLMTVHLSAANSLSWLSKILNKPDINQLLHQAEQLPNKQIPLFLPYLSGERTPHNNPYARGTFFGLSNHTDPATLTQAVLEGVAFAFADGQQVMQQAGVNVCDISVVGGGARSRYWGQIISTVLQKPLIYRHLADLGGAYGAARLAWFSTHGGKASEVLTAPEVDHIIEPDNNKHEYYAKRFLQYQRLYLALKTEFGELINHAES